MNGYIAQRRGRFYVVIYEGLDPVTGKRGADGIPPAPTVPRPNASPASSQRRKRAESK